MSGMIPIAGPLIGAKERQYVLDAVEHGWYEHANDYIVRFEHAFAAYCGARYAIALPSCTSALHLSLLALGVGPGDEVIVPDITWIASVAPVIYVGATPVFADIEPTTWCLSERSVAPLVTSRTRAIIGVNLYGQMPDYPALATLGIPIIEDAAESLGSKWQGRQAGSFGITGCFSFHGSKTLCTGEGGMLVTDEESIWRQCLRLRDHGRDPGDVGFQNQQVGYKYKMSNLQAALGLAQLENVAQLVAKKRHIYAQYAKGLAQNTAVSLNPVQAELYNSYWMTTALIDTKLSKPELLNYFQLRQIATRPFFYPLSSLPAMLQAKDQPRAQRDNVISYSLSPRGINLPSALTLSDSQIECVVAAVKQLSLEFA